MSLLPNLDQMTDNEKMAVLESIQKSIAQSKEIQKKKIGENVDLVVQALKKIESDIRDRFDSVGNSIEKRVLSIQDGRDGINGKDGRDGKDGRNGKDGLKGDKGDVGQDGIDGVDGLDGVSVANANIDFDGSLIIALSDGREINVGEVVSTELQERIKIISSGGQGGGGGSGTVTSVATGTGLTGGTITTTGTIALANTAVSAGSYTLANITVDAQGRITSAANGSAGSGTVTSVALSGGTTGLTVTGSPITTSGTITLAGTLAVANGGTGTATPSIVAGTNITVTGTWPNQTITASGGSGSVTSVAATVPAFLSVAGSPITTSGTLAITLSGTALPVLNGGTGVTTSTGSGNNVLSTSPTFVTPILGTPTSATLTNATGLPISTGVSGLGTGVATALAVNVGTAGAPVVNGGALGTPSGGTATNLTGLPLSTGVTGTLPIANGGTGLSTLTANNVILGNGTSAPTFVAPSTSGNVLTSNGTTWQSTTPTSGGITTGKSIAMAMIFGF